MARFVFLAACIAAFVLCGEVTAGPARAYDELAELAQTEMTTAKIPGLSIVVVNDRGVVWSRSFGVVKEGSDTPVTADTVYRVGALSTVVTAAAVLRQMEAGRLTLDEPVQKFLPGFKPRNRFANARPITVRALLAHYSGMPTDSWRGMMGKSPANVCEVMPVLSATWLTDAPQTRYVQSSLDYTALGCLIETLSHRPFAAAVRDDLLAPLGMNASSFTEPQDARGRIAAPHRDGKPIVTAVAREAPAKGLFTTPNDLARLVRMLLAQGEIDGHAILKADTVASMFRRQFPEARWPFAQSTGFAWRLWPFPGENEVARQPVQYPGYSGQIALLPKRKLGVVVLTNDGTAGVAAVKLANKALELALQEQTGSAPAFSTKAFPPPEPVETGAAMLDRYTGHYAVFTGIAPVERKDAKLSTSFQGNDFDLIPVANDRFVPRARVALGLFSVPLDGYSIGMTTVEGRQIAVLEGQPDPLLFAKPDPVLFEKADLAAMPDAWRQRVGAWRVANPDGWHQIKDVRLETEGNMLVLRTGISSPVMSVEEKALSYALRPVDGNIAVIMENGMGGGDTIEAVTRDGHETLIFSGYVLERQVDAPR